MTTEGLFVFRRIFEYGPGAMLGASDFFMNFPARFRVTAAEPCRLLRLSRDGLQRLTRQRPEVRPRVSCTYACIMESLLAVCWQKQHAWRVCRSRSLQPYACRPMQVSTLRLEPPITAQTTACMP